LFGSEAAAALKQNFTFAVFFQGTLHSPAV